MQQMEHADCNDQGASIWMQQKLRFTPWVRNALGLHVSLQFYSVDFYHREEISTDCPAISHPFLN